MHRTLILVQTKAFTNGSTIKVGRHSASDFQLYSERISRHHLTISIEHDGQILLEDTNSLNGTFVNGRRVKFDSLDNPATDDLRLCNACGFQLAFQPIELSADDRRQGITRKFALVL